MPEKVILSVKPHHNIVTYFILSVVTPYVIRKHDQFKISKCRNYSCNESPNSDIKKFTFQMRAIYSRIQCITTTAKVWQDGGFLFLFMYMSSNTSVSVWIPKFFSSSELSNSLSTALCISIFWFFPISPIENLNKLFAHKQCTDISELRLNSLRPSDIYASVISLLWIIACHLVGSKPISEPMLEYC